MANNYIRRNVLKGLGGLAGTTWLTPLVYAQTKLHVGVVGGGIVGASIALHLASAGAKVTVFEKTAIAAGATGNSFAWINGANTNKDYRDLRLRSLEGWRKLDKQLELNIIWGGAIKWQPKSDAADRVRAVIEAMVGTDYPYKEINAEKFAQVGAEFTPGGIDIAGLSTSVGHLDPVKVTHKLMMRAIALGAEVKMPCSVQGLFMSGDKLKGVHTSSGDVALDRLVVASGVDAPSLTSRAGFNPTLLHEPGILVHTSPVDVTTNKVVYGPGVHFKQFADGRIVGADSETPPKTMAHKLIRGGKIPFPNKAIENMHSQRIVDKIATFLPVAKTAKIDRLTLGFRPMPADRFPILGYIPNSSDIYVAVMHSGVTLAPIVGQMVTSEIINDQTETTLYPFRPDRTGIS